MAKYPSLIIPENWEPPPGSEVIAPDAVVKPLDLAKQAAPSLGIDAKPLDLAQKVAPSLGIDLSLHSATADTKAPVQDITPPEEPPAPGVPDQPLVARQDRNRFDTEAMTPSPVGRQIAMKAAKSLGIDFSQADAASSDYGQEMARRALEAKGQSGNAPLGMFAPGGMPEIGASLSPEEKQQKVAAGELPQPSTKEAAAVQVGSTLQQMHGTGGFGGEGGIAAAGALGLGGIRGSEPARAPERGTLSVGAGPIKGEPAAVRPDPAHELAAKAAPQLGLPPPEAPRSGFKIEVDPAETTYTHYNIKDPNGNVVGEAHFTLPKPGSGSSVAKLEDIFTTDWQGKRAGSLGPTVLNDLLAQFRQNHPDITSITGNRVSGARTGGKTVAPQQGKPVALSLPPPEAAPFTASPPAPAVAERAGQGLPPPGTPPPPPTAGPPPGAPPPLDPRAPAPFLENAPPVTTRPMAPPRVRAMENDLFAIKSADRGRKEIVQTKTLPAIQRNLANSFGRDAARIDREAYHDIEAGRPLDPKAQSYVAREIEPRRQQNLADYRELQRYNMPDLVENPELNPDHMHRMRVGKTGGMDEASGMAETVGYGKGKLSTRPSSARQRSIHAMEDEAGNVKVVTEHPGNDAVFVWENGKRRTEAGGLIRTKEARDIPGEVIPGRTTLSKPVVAKVKEGGLTQARYTEPKQIPDRVTQDRTTEPSLVNDKFRKGSEFVDMRNKRWIIRDATTAEIHNAGVRDVVRREVAPGQFRITYGEPVKFYESALASVMMNHLELQKALDTARFRDKWQKSPEFKTHSVAEADASPEQKREWQRIEAPGWQGRFYEPSFAEPIIDHLVGQGYRIPLIDPASNFATRWLFNTGIGSIAHGVNEHLQRLVARGVGGNLNVVARASTALKAFDETMNKGAIWQDYRNKGASFPSDSQHWRSVEDSILRTVGMQLKQEPGFKGWAKRHGLYSDEAGSIVSHAIGKAVFEYGDFIALQHGLELERRGFTRQQAIERMNRVLPTYRIPSRIITKGKAGRAMAQAVASPSTFQFGRFTYARFKGLSSIIEDIAGKGKSFRDRKDGLSRLITVAAVMAFVAPFIDKQLQKATGDKNTHFLWGGSLGMVARALRMAEDVRAGRKNAVEGVLDALTASVNLGPVFKELIQQYTGRDLYNDRQFVAPTDPAIQDIAERASHVGSSFFAPTQALSDPKRYLVEDPLRLSNSAPFDPNARSLKGMKKQLGQQYGRFDRLPSVLRAPLHYLGTD